jgi:hypothetical protein
MLLEMMAENRGFDCELLAGLSLLPRRCRGRPAATARRHLQALRVPFLRHAGAKRVAAHQHQPVHREIGEVLGNRRLHDNEDLAEIAAGAIHPEQFVVGARLGVEAQVSTPIRAGPVPRPPERSVHSIRRLGRERACSQLVPAWIGIGCPRRRWANGRRLGDGRPRSAGCSADPGRREMAVPDLMTTAGEGSLTLGPPSRAAYLRTNQRTTAVVAHVPTLRIPLGTPIC